jgi:hypothetical protein
MNLAIKTFQTLSEYVSALDGIFKDLYDVENALVPLISKYEIGILHRANDTHSVVNVIIDKDGIGTHLKEENIETPPDYWKNYTETMFPDYSSKLNPLYVYKFDIGDWQLGVIKSSVDQNTISFHHNDDIETIRIKLLYLS